MDVVLRLMGTNPKGVKLPQRSAQAGDDLNLVEVRDALPTWIKRRIVSAHKSNPAFVGRTNPAAFLIESLYLIFGLLR